MNYNKAEILDMIAKTEYLDPTNIFDNEYNYDFVHRMGENFIHNYNYACGATKLVFIPKDKSKDYVIKIPYTGYYDEEEECYSPFEEAESDDYCWDYCAGEVNRYIIAEDEGFGRCFAKSSFLGYVNDYPIYIQERCVTFRESREEHEHSLVENTHTKSICKKNVHIDLDWLTDFKLYYGENLLVNFLYFLNIMQWDDDLRDENIGYIGDRPVLIDYSGFLD